ncbi:hypothetical protein [Baekduia sp. Peel2402]|uniref:hypothetical protein n=1 Tax=Baekduia sp. Peel2402 TaxID=3458296 RepID=UPI00403E5BE9
MTGLTWMVGCGVAACSTFGVLLVMALCASASRADAEAAGHRTRLGAGDDDRRATAAGPDDRAARHLRTALRARTGWVFSASDARGPLVATGRGGAVVPPAGEALALRAARLAVLNDVPIIVPVAPGGPLGEAVLVGVAVPFADGRTGALVVAGGGGMATRPWATHVLQELAIERAELGMPVASAARSERFTVARRQHAYRR